MDKFWLNLLGFTTRTLGGFVHRLEVVLARAQAEQDVGAPAPPNGLPDQRASALETSAEDGPPAHWQTQFGPGGPPVHWVKEFERAEAPPQALEYAGPDEGSEGVWPPPAENRASGRREDRPSQAEPPETAPAALSPQTPAARLARQKPPARGMLLCLPERDPAGTQPARAGQTELKKQSCEPPEPRSGAGSPQPAAAEARAGRPSAPAPARPVVQNDEQEAGTPPHFEKEDSPFQPTYRPPSCQSPITPALRLARQNRPDRRAGGFQPAHADQSEGQPDLERQPSGPSELRRGAGSPRFAAAEKVGKTRARRPAAPVRPVVQNDPAAAGALPYLEAQGNPFQPTYRQPASPESQSNVFPSLAPRPFPDQAARGSNSPGYRPAESLLAAPPGEPCNYRGPEAYGVWPDLPDDPPVDDPDWIEAARSVERTARLEREQRGV
jgi:hypothetical protein